MKLEEDHATWKKHQEPPDPHEGSTTDEEEAYSQEPAAKPSVQHSDSKPAGPSGSCSSSSTGNTPEKVATASAGGRRLEDSAQQSTDTKTQLRELQTRLEEESAARKRLEGEMVGLCAELTTERNRSRQERESAEALEAMLTEREEDLNELHAHLTERRDEIDELRSDLLETEKCRKILAEQLERVPTSPAQLAKRAAEAAAATPGAVVLDERLGYSTRIVRLPECGTELLVPRTPSGQRPLAAAAAPMPTEVALFSLNVDGCVSAPKESRPRKVRRVAELAKTHRVGIVVLQEATAEYEALLREALPTGWGVASAATGTGTAGVRETHVFAWDPTVVERLHKTPSALLGLTSSFRRPPVVAHLALRNGGSLLIASVHAAPEQDEAKLEAAALGAEMLPLLREQYGEPVMRTLMVCGDFNLAPPGELLEPKSGRAFGGLREMGWIPTNKEATNLEMLTERAQVYDNVFVHQSVHQALTAEVLKFDELALDHWREETNRPVIVESARRRRLVGEERAAFDAYLKGKYAELKNTDPATMKDKMHTKWLSHGLGYSDHRGLLLRIPAAALRHKAEGAGVTPTGADGGLATVPSGKTRAMRALVEAMSTAVVHAVEDRAARDEHAQEARQQQEHLEAKFADKPQCIGYNRTGRNKGQQCKRLAAEGSYCRDHGPKDVPNDAQRPCRPSTGEQASTAARTLHTTLHSSQQC